MDQQIFMSGLWGDLIWTNRGRDILEREIEDLKDDYTHLYIAKSNPFEDCRNILIKSIPDISCNTMLNSYWDTRPYYFIAHNTKLFRLPFGQWWLNGNDVYQYLLSDLWHTLGEPKLVEIEDQFKHNIYSNSNKINYYVFTGPEGVMLGDDLNTPTFVLARAKIMTDCELKQNISLVDHLSSLGWKLSKL